MYCSLTVGCLFVVTFVWKMSGFQFQSVSPRRLFETPWSTERGNAYILVCLLMFSSVLFTKGKWEEAHLSTILSPVLHSQEIKLLWTFHSKLKPDLLILTGLVLPTQKQQLVPAFGQTLYIVGKPQSSSSSSKDLQLMYYLAAKLSYWFAK